jgi:formylglycine-generating enzyme required for sulfatase activity
LIADLDAPTLLLPAAPSKTAEGHKPAPPHPAPSRPVWLMPSVLVAIIALAVGIYFATRPQAATDAKTPATQAEVRPVLAKTIEMKGGAMVLVEAGSFLAGQKKQPQTLPAFYIDKTEVSNADYAQFCAETKHALPEGFRVDKPELPVVNVLILDARAFAAWAGKRLPKGREWEKAARGKYGFFYPWGNDKDPARANVGSGRLLPVSALPNGASPYGALNMSGNVWELVDEVSPPGEGAMAEFTTLFKGLRRAPPTRDEAWYMVRGQSYVAQEKLEPEGLWDIFTVPERGSQFNIGFRCVKDAE